MARPGWGEVAKYVVEMGWPMNAVARRLGILLIFFPPHALAGGGGPAAAYTRARLIKRPDLRRVYLRVRFIEPVATSVFDDRPKSRSTSVRSICGQLSNH